MASYFEVHLADELVTIGRDDGNFFESDGVLRFFDLGSIEWDERLLLSEESRLVLVGTKDGPHVLAAIEVIEHFLHLVDQRGVACKLLDFLIGDHESSDSFRKVDEQ